MLKGRKGKHPKCEHKKEEEQVSYETQWSGPLQYRDRALHSIPYATIQVIDNQI